MIEIADELERMAKYFEERADGRAKIAAAKGGSDVGNRRSGEANGLREAASELRDRAAELRAQRSGPMYKLQPKPATVEANQWWAEAHCEAEVVASTWPDGHDRWASFRGRNRPDEMTRVLLDSDDWLYLGDGPEPAR